jgi:hypothetical protein
MRTSALFFIIFHVTVVLAAPVPKVLKGQKTFFPTKLGSKWEYATEGQPQVREIIRATSKDGVRTITVQMTSGVSKQTWDILENTDGVFRSTLYNEALDPPQLILKANAKPGDEWEGEYKRGGAVTERYKRVVGQPEKVSTPNGEYDALPVTQTNPDDEEDTVTIWYAEGVGMVKLLQRNSEPLLLQKYTPGQDKE